VLSLHSCGAPQVQHELTLITGLEALHDPVHRDEGSDRPSMYKDATGSAASSRILIVDDDRALTTTLAQIYTAAGYDVDVANDAAEALACIRAAPPALLMLDLYLGDTNGLDFIDVFRQQPACASVPIILGSGSGDIQRVRSRMASLGVVMLMRKPYDIETLLTAATELVEVTLQHA
jgi:DNA-binding response OmpR family regulator